MTTPTNASSTTRYCPRCGEHRGVEQFSRNAAAVNAGYLQTWCKPCMADHKRQWLHDLRQRTGKYRDFLKQQREAKAAQRERRKARLAAQTTSVQPPFT